MLQFQLQAWCPIPFVPEEDLVPIMGVKIMVACRTIVPGTGLDALGAALAAATPALAQEVAPEDDSIVVTAQRENETQVNRQGTRGALGSTDAMALAFPVTGYSQQLSPEQHQRTTG